MRTAVATGLLACVVGCGGGGNSTSDAAITDAPIVDAAIADAAPPDGGNPDAPTLPAGAPPVGACRSGWCWVYPLPQGNPLQAIWGTSASDVWAVGTRGTSLHYDGVAWTAHPADGDLRYVWGASASDVWAAGGAQVLRWNGAAWAVSTTVGDALALGGTGASDVWVYDFANKDVVQWNGATWAPHPLPAAGWQPIAFGGAPGTTLVVSKAGGIAKWLGNAWGIVDAGTHAANAAAIIDATHVALAQDGGALSLWNGATWTTVTAPVAAGWTAIAATSLDDVWVAGNRFGLPYRYHWNGASWSSADDPGDSGFARGLWLDPTDHPWAAMDDAEVAVWSGTSWVRKTTGDNDVIAVGGTAEDDLWTVAAVPVTVARNRVMRWNGSAWNEIAFPFDATYHLGGVWAAATDDAWIAAGHAIAGDKIERVMLHWTGAAWSSVGPFGTEDGILSPEGFTAVWGSGAGDVYAVARTAVYHYNGAAWKPIAALAGGSDVFGTADNDVYVLDGTSVWHWNGLAWSSKTAPAAVAHGWATSATDIWLQGDPGSGAGVHYDGALFSVYQQFSGEGVPVGTATDMFTFHYDKGEHMTEWVGGFAGTPTVTSAPFVPLGKGWRAPSGRVYAPGGPGLLVH